MLTDSMLCWRGEVILTRDLSVAGDRTEFYNRARSGEFTSIARGVFIRTNHWVRLSPDERYYVLLFAATQVDPGIVLSHQSAAAAWRLPMVGSWPNVVHVIEWRSGRVHSTKMFRRHHPPEDVVPVVVGEFTVTSLPRTVVDVAASMPFGSSVAMADAALRRAAHPHPDLPSAPIDRSQLFAELENVALRHGSARARRVIQFADARADRPGESLSRVAMAIARITAPDLQVVLYGASGARYVVDFFWPQFNVIGEFDGEAKYSDPRFLRGRTPEQALVEEKYREDDLRAAGHGMSRWGWDYARSPALLRAKLLGAGVR